MNEQSKKADTVLISHEMCIEMCNELTEFVRVHPWGDGWKEKADEVCWKIGAAGRLFQRMAADRKAGD